MKNILIVEDEKDIREVLTEILNMNSFNHKALSSVKEAELVTKNEEFSLILLDVNLPDGNGFELCEKIRTTDNLTPIVFLTANIDESSVLRGFDVGANDYIKKPFSPAELIARVKAHLGLNRKVSKDSSNQTYQNLTLNKELRVCEMNGKSTELNQRQVDILSYFIENAGKAVTREEIIDQLNIQGKNTQRTVDSHLSQMRKKLESLDKNGVNIKSIYGIGYRLI